MHTSPQVNIDAFLASVEAGIAELNDVADNATAILTNIERVLKRVKNTSLIDISDEKTYTLGGGGLETFVRSYKQSKEPYDQPYDRYAQKSPADRKMHTAATSRTKSCGGRRLLALKSEGRKRRWRRWWRW